MFSVSSFYMQNAYVFLKMYGLPTQRRRQHTYLLNLFLLYTNIIHENSCFDILYANSSFWTSSGGSFFFSMDKINIATKEPTTSARK